jgi:chromosome segregation ATPase
LVARVRELLAAEPTTDAELRMLVDQADAWARALLGQMEGSERQLDQLAADPGSSLSEIAAELNRIEGLRPQLAETRSLLSELDNRIRALRTEWLSRLAGSSGPRRR